MKFNVHPQFEETFDWVRNGVILHQNTKIPNIVNIEDGEILKYVQLLSKFSEIEKLLVIQHIVDYLPEDYLTNTKVRTILQNFANTLHLLSDIAYTASWSETCEKKKLDIKKPHIDHFDSEVRKNLTFEEKYNKISSTKKYQYSLFLLDYITDGNREVDVREMNNINIPANVIFTNYCISIVYTTIMIRPEMDENTEIYMLDLLAERLGVYNYKQWGRQITLASIIED